MATITSFTAGNPGSVGQTLSIAGSGLSSTSRVNFGNKSVTPTTVSATLVTCPIPQLCAGQFNVNLTVGTATSNSLPFFYAAAPAVSSVSPTEGAASPGTITVNGSGFLNASAVTFGAQGAGTALTVVNDTQLTVTAPTHPTPITGCQDTVDITVTTPGGTSAVSVSDQFTYYDAPAITAPISPATGPAGTSVTVTGTCFDNVTSVVFTPPTGPSIPAAGFRSASTTQLTVTVPSGLTTGTAYDIQVTTPGGTSAKSANDVFTAA
jgi:hypothetical protein